MNVDLVGHQQLAIERVICKAFSIAFDVTKKIRSAFKSILWRMGHKPSLRY